MRAFLPLLAVAASASVAHADQPAPPAPVAVEIVLQGHEIAMGNDDIETEDSAARYLGMLHGLKTRLAAQPLAKVLPPGSRVGLITYADKPMIRWPLRDVTMFAPEVLGDQRDYYRMIGTDLVSAIDEGLAELTQVHADKKLLIVISDGNDTNMDAATTAFVSLRATAQKNGITPISVIYKNVLSAPENPIVAFDPEAQHVVSIDSIVNNMEQRILLALASPAVRQTVTPPPVIVVTPTCEATWFMRWRWQLAIGSVLALIAMGGVWFVRRERL